MTKIVPQPLKGFRDFLPEEMIIRQRVVDILRKVFESWGFAPLETPSIEYSSLLLGKYGEDAEKMVYTFEDKGGRKIGLIYDLTVPTARVLARLGNKIPLPFRRYQIQRIWRAEKPQKGRYREILQCDVDSFGVASPLADAEIVAIIYNSLKALGFEKFTIKINSRQVLFELMEKLEITQKNQQLSILRTIDKLDKAGSSKVKNELEKKGLSSKMIIKLLDLIKNAKPDKNLAELFVYLDWLGVDKKFWKFAPTLVRGLDYYTGPVFETYVEKPKIGSITGGGRYDKLVEMLGGPSIPATGTTIGLDRICDVIKQQNLWPQLSLTSTKVLVTIFSPQYTEKSIQVVSLLRFKGKINTELYPDPQAKLDKQLKYADRKGITFVIIIGPDEVKDQKATIKNLKTGAQQTLSLDKIDQFFLNLFQ